jgi:RHS repeat-associated protein
VHNAYDYDPSGNRDGPVDPYNRLREDRSHRYDYDAEGNVVHRWTYEDALKHEFKVENDRVESPISPPIVLATASTVSSSVALPAGENWLYLAPVVITSTQPMDTVDVTFTVRNGGTLLHEQSRSVAVSATAAANTYITDPVKLKFTLSSEATQASAAVKFDFSQVTPMPTTTFSGTVYFSVLDGLYNYEWDHHNRLVRSHEETTPPTSSLTWDSSQFDAHVWDWQIDYQYDVLGNRIHKSITGVNHPTRTESYVPENGRTLLQFRNDSRLDRHYLYAASVDELLAVEKFDYTPGGDLQYDEVIWTLADHQGTIRDLYSADSHRDQRPPGAPGSTAALQHLDNDPFGNPTDTAPNGDALSTAVSNRYLGLPWDEEVELYFVADRPYDPVAGRLLNTNAIAEASGNAYVFANNSPVDRQHVGRQSGYNGAVDDSGFWGMFQHNVNPANQWRDGNYGMAIAQGLGWTAFVVGTGGAGLAAAGGTGLTAAGVGIYVAKTAGTAGVSTAVEGTVAGYMGDESFNPFSAFARNFAIDAAIGWIPGAAESKAAAKVGSMGLRIGGRMGQAVGRYAVHYAREVAVETVADTAWSVGVEGRDVSDAFTQSLVGNMVGQGVGDVLSAGLRRGMQHLGIPQFGRICFVAGTLVERGHGPKEPARFTAIERIELGERVNTDAPAEAVGSGRSELGEPDAATWRKLVLRAVNAADADVEIELLRPVVWLGTQRAAVGVVIDVDLPELNTRGPARVMGIEPSPEIEAGAGTVVTGRFRHVAKNLLNVHVEGLNQPIGCTEQHPFWSVTRGEFVPANRLQVGELLLTDTGHTAQVVWIEARHTAQCVHNLEVGGPHVYRVSELGLLVHNASWDVEPPGFATHGSGIGVDYIDTLITTAERQRRIFDLTDPRAFIYGRGRHPDIAVGSLSAEPLDPLNVLRHHSIWVDPQTTVRRVGVDKANGQFVVFDETHPQTLRSYRGPREYHGHAVSWEGLRDHMKRALIRAGLVTHKGKIL